MQKRVAGYSLIILGIVVFFLKPLTNFTGMAIADNLVIVKNLWFYSIGACMIVMGLMITIDDIIGARPSASKKLIKTSEYLGKKAIYKGRGSIPRTVHNEEEVYRELGQILLGTRGANQLISNEEIEKRYTKHQLQDSGKIDLHLSTKENFYTWDALALSTAHRGKCRYVFDNNGRYLGLSEHTKSGAGYRYRWL